MKSRRILVLTLALFVLVALACTRSASGPMPYAAMTEEQSGALPTQVVLQTQDTTSEQAVMPTIAAGSEEASATAPPPTLMAPPSPTPLPPTPVATTVVAPPTPTPTPVPPQPTATGQRQIPSEYVLHHGEFPFCIARRFNIHPEDLLRANGISPWQTYFAPGTRLRIPQNARPFTDFAPRALRPHPTTYTVRGSGETLYSIACLFGDVWPEDIAQANGLPLNDKPLAPGTVLHIP